MIDYTAVESGSAPWVKSKRGRPLGYDALTAAATAKKVLGGGEGLTLGQDKYQNKVKSFLSANDLTKKINPFLDKNGNIFNRYINYQQALDNPNVTQKAKGFITQATGLSQSSVPETKFEDVDISNLSKANNTGLGYISSKYEVGGWNPGRISSGKGDYGGVSYGIPQFSTKTGSADSFVNWLKETNPEIGQQFGNYKAGTSEFSKAWTDVNAKYGDNFGKLQTQYAYNKFVEPLVNFAKAKTGVDYTRSPALMELAYSTAIQFGGGELGLSALGNVNAQMSDKDIINASYDKKINNVGSFFKSSSKGVQNSVKNRFINERNDVISLLGASSPKIYTSGTKYIPGTKVSDTNSYNNSAAKGQCVWYVRGRMKEKLGKDTGAVGNANQMWHNVGDRAKLPASADSIKPNTIASYQTGTSSAGAKYGHVIYIEDVIGDTVYYTEGGSSYHNKGTDGVVKTASKQGILNGINSNGSRFGSGLIGLIDVSKI